MPSWPLFALKVLGAKRGFGFVPLNSMDLNGDSAPSVASRATLSSLSLAKQASQEIESTPLQRDTAAWQPRAGF